MKSNKVLATPMVRAAVLAIPVAAAAPDVLHAQQVKADNESKTATGTINTSATSSAGYGLWALNGGSITTTPPLAVNTTGTTAHAAVAQSGGAIDIANGSSITTSGGGALAAQALGGGTINIFDGSSITTAGVNGVAVQAQSNSQINIAGSTITTTGVTADGLVASGAGAMITVTDTTIAVQTSGFGLIAGSGGLIQATGVSVTAPFEGVFIEDGGSVILNGSTVTSTGFAALFGAAGTNTATIDGSTLTAAQGRGIGVSVGTLNVAITDSSVMGGSTLLSVFNNGTLNLTTDASELIGMAITAAGSTSNVTLQNGTVWNMTGDSNVTNLTNSASSILFSPPVDGVFKTLTTVNYVGAGGTLGLNTFLGTDGSPSDKLVIDGGTATGSTGLLITNAGGPGAQTTGNGILVVEAINGGTTALGAFNLAGPVVAGAYNYDLFRSSVDASGPENWYLRSDGYRPDLPSDASVPPLATQYGFAMLGTFHERMGDPLANTLATGARLPCSTARLGGDIADAGKWGRVMGESGTHEDNSFFAAGPDYSWRFAGLQTGLDLLQQENRSGCDHAGLSLGVGAVRADVDPLASIADGRIDMDAYTFGGYWTHLAQSGWYVDVVGQGTYYDANANTGITTFKTNGFGFAGSMEAGYPIGIGAGVWVEPQAQLIYQHMNFDDLSDGTALISFDTTKALRGRVGARLVKPWNDASLWVRGDLWHEFIGKTVVTVAGLNGANGVSFETPFEGTWAKIGVGANGPIDKHIDVFATAAYQQGIDDRDFSAWSGYAGLTYRW